MKPWIIAAITAGALLLVGVPATALALGFRGVVQTSTSEPEQVMHSGPDAHHRDWKPEPHDMGPGKWHRFGMPDLTPAQRERLADRLDAGAKRMQQAADCLRDHADEKALRSCLSKTFPRHGTFRHWRHGPKGSPSGGVSPPPRQG